MKKYFFLLLCVFFGCISQSGAQYGPMGFGNADGSEAPAGYEQPRLLLWLDGSDVNTTSGNEVVQWNDQSGNDHHFTTSAAANRPTFQATTGPAGTPCLSFDGVDDRLVCSDFELGSDAFTIYYIIKTNDGDFGLFSYGNAEYGSTWWNNSNNTLWEYRDGGTSEGTSGFANGFTYNSTGEAVIGDIPLVGGGYQAGAAFDGQIAEIIIWEGFMQRPIARMMRTYLWTKYGETSPNNFREGNNGWDKFQGYQNGSAGEYYNPIAVGQDMGGNPGFHNESRIKGLILRVNEDPSSEWTGGRRYMCAGWVPDAGNSIVSTNLPSGVDARWSRVWEVGSSDDGNQRFRIGFDFGEGIEGEIPQVADNFVLLRRTGNSGSFGIVPESQYLERSIVDDEVVFRLNGNDIDDGNRFYTIGTKNASISSLDGSDLRTWYAYQTGNWSNPSTWTLDGSAAPSYVNPGGNSLP
ncbi:MAG: hypothetical protein LC664_16370, partial [Flavobacteriales bacterium]|nr:hypothetical protein [Flavobacteriales bacterium]